jgi:centromeric protein E
VISKLTDVRASHVPYRDSKLTRILQSSLSGHDRVSLICTVTPASSSSEETHNTLKFAHRAKHIEIQAEQNKVFHAYLLSALIFCTEGLFWFLTLENCR